MTVTDPGPGLRVRGGGVSALWAGNPGAVVERGLIAARSSSWLVVLSGFFEPVFYLASMGIGIGAYVHGITTTSGPICHTRAAEACTSTVVAGSRVSPVECWTTISLSRVIGTSRSSRAMVAPSGRHDGRR